MIVTRPQISKIFQRAAEIVGEGWCQGAFVECRVSQIPKLGIDFAEEALSPLAERWCLLGALYRATGEVTGEYPRRLRSPDNRMGFVPYLHLYLRRVLGQPASAWNDDSDRTQKEVIALLHSLSRKCLK